jgi:hypothetical protein
MDRKRDGKKGIHRVKLGNLRSKMFNSCLIMENTVPYKALGERVFLGMT